jgi:hemerythrin-like domain-containing protein
MDAVSPLSLFATVHRFHQYLDELLHLHQESLLERDTVLALEFWQLHVQMLRLHIELEEEWLLPALERSVVKPAWGANIYRAEHGKILSLGDKLNQAISSLHDIGPGRRALITLLDKQRSYKNVLEHHEEREEKGLLPELDAALSAREIHQLNSACGKCWDDLYQKQRHTVTRLSRRLDAYPGHIPSYK